MNEELRKDLDTIDQMLLKWSGSSATNLYGGLKHNPLWQVLTALRGPDDLSKTKKDQHTIPVREAAFPKTAAKYGDYWRGFNASSHFPWVEPMLKPGAYALDHFEDHAYRGSRALSLPPASTSSTSS